MQFLNFQIFWERYKILVGALLAWQRRRTLKVWTASGTIHFVKDLIELKNKLLGQLPVYFWCIKFKQGFYVPRNWRNRSAFLKQAFEIQLILAKTRLLAKLLLYDMLFLTRIDYVFLSFEMTHFNFGHTNFHVTTHSFTDLILNCLKILINCFPRKHILHLVVFSNKRKPKRSFIFMKTCNLYLTKLVNWLWYQKHRTLRMLYLQ